MRISDWSSDVCSSDLARRQAFEDFGLPFAARADRHRNLFHRVVFAHAVYEGIAADLDDGNLRRQKRLPFGALDLDLYQHRSEEHTSELQSLKRITYAAFC